MKLWINNTLLSSFTMSELDKGLLPVRIATLTSNTLTTSFISLLAILMVSVQPISSQLSASDT